MSPSSPRPPSTWLVTSLIGLLCLIWGSTWIVIQEGLEDLPPMTSAGVRFLVAAVIVSALAPWLRHREGGETPRAFVWVTVGAISFALSYGIVYWSETRLPSGIVAVLWSLFPMCMAICGHLFLPGERLGRLQWGGFLIGLLGVALLFMTDLREFGPEGIPTALVLCLSPIVSALATTVLKRYGSVLVSRNAMWLGALLLLGAAAAAERDVDVQWTGQAIGSVAYLAIAGTVVTFLLYFWLLRHAPAYKMSLIAYVVPGIALLLGRWVGDEPVRGTTVAGALLILLGVGGVARARRPQGDPTDAPQPRTEAQLRPRRGTLGATTAQERTG